MAQINIMVSRHSAFYSPLISTVTGGFLEAEGLQPTYAVMEPDSPPWAAMSAGTVHVIQSAVSRNWGFLERGEATDVVHFAQINVLDGFFITARQPDPGFTWDKLAGRPVLVDHGGQPHAMFRYAVQRMGVDFAAIDAVDAGNVEAIDAAFRAGSGDYVHQQGPAPQQLEKDGIGHVVASVGAAIGPVAFSSLAATRAWLAGDMAQAFMRAYRKSRHYVRETAAAEIARAEAGFFKGIDSDVLTHTIAAYQNLGCWAPEVEIPRDAYETALDVFLHSDRITRRHPYDTVVAPPPDSATL